MVNVGHREVRPEGERDSNEMKCACRLNAESPFRKRLGLP
jgi:hypothetical protein